MSAIAGTSARGRRLAARPGWAAPDRLAWIVLIALLAGGGLLLLHETRGTTFWFELPGGNGDFRTNDTKEAEE